MKREIKIAIYIIIGIFILYFGIVFYYVYTDGYNFKNFNSCDTNFNVSNFSFLKTSENEINLNTSSVLISYNKNE